MKKVTSYWKLSAGLTVGLIAFAVIFAYAVVAVGNTDWTWWYELTLPQAIVVAALVIGVLGID